MLYFVLRNGRKECIGDSRTARPRAAVTCFSNMWYHRTLFPPEMLRKKRSRPKSTELYEGEEDSIEAPIGHRTPAFQNVERKSTDFFFKNQENQHSRMVLGLDATAMRMGTPKQVTRKGSMICKAYFD